MKTWITRASLVAAISLFLHGCGGVANRSTEEVDRMNYEQAINSAVSRNGYAGQFNRIFPGARNIIHYYDGRVGPTRFSSSIGLYGRYVLWILYPITLNDDRNKVISEGDLELYLEELPRITDTGEGTYYFQINRFSKDIISAKLWERLVEAGGNFAEVGIMLETNKPVANFESEWRNFR